MIHTFSLPLLLSNFSYPSPVLPVLGHQTIKFFKPLTVIVGDNGCGKTVRGRYFMICMSTVNESRPADHH